jgi:Domain of unknown function (DUF4357)
LRKAPPPGSSWARLVNWTGHVLSAPRTRLEAALKRDELRRTGVYLLFGDEFGSDLPAVYIGEGDDVSSRLYSHAKDDQKAFWERFIAVTNKDMNLTKAHVKYLEGRLISMLKDAKKCDVRNKTEPTFDKLPEADISDMESFLEELKIVLPVVGFDFLRKPVVASREASKSQLIEQFFALAHPKKGIFARATEIDGEFVILSGSTGSLNESQSFDEARQAFRHQVFDTGRAVKVNQETFRTTENIAFSSPSAAAVFVFGTSRNGRTDWLQEGTSRTFGAWQDDLMDRHV